MLAANFKLRGLRFWPREGAEDHKKESVGGMLSRSVDIPKQRSVAKLGLACLRLEGRKHATRRYIVSNRFWYSGRITTTRIGRQLLKGSLNVTKITPDYSLTRNDVELSEWLWKLLDESKSVRREAVEAIQAMDWGLPSIHTHWENLAEAPDIESQRVRFAAGVKNAFAKTDFNKRQYIERLGAFRIALKGDYSERVTMWATLVEHWDGKYERLARRLNEVIESTDERAAKQQAQNRLEKLTEIYCHGSFNRKNDPLPNAEILSPAGIAAAMVFDLLDIELLAAPEVLEALLAHSELRRHALSALERIGPAALQFAPQLIDDIDRVPLSEKKTKWFDAPHALGAIGKDDPFVVNEMISRLSHDESVVRTSAAQVLQHMGLAVCNREREICNLLLPMLRNENEWSAGLPASASVGRELPTIRASILAFAGPREKQPRTYVGFPDIEHDLTMHERGEAISAMKYFTRYPDECLPILIEAMESYDEYDPDECYDGPLGRISAVVAKFGTSASPAVLPLVKHLNDWPDEMPRNILTALATIGPPAGAAIPALLALRERLFLNKEGDLNQDVIDRTLDPVGWTIQQIQGTPKVEK